MPTGGVSESNLVDWFNAGAFAVGAGSKLCPKEYAFAGEFEKITDVATKFMAAIKAARAS
jgi:2-dehydro-3-deoxyphosphogluconate aldolase/(4S)-4-hydroxy-2-oxoglutarate aldolase